MSVRRPPAPSYQHPPVRRWARWLAVLAVLAQIVAATIPQAWAANGADTFPAVCLSGAADHQDPAAPQTDGRQHCPLCPLAGASLLAAPPAASLPLPAGRSWTAMAPSGRDAVLAFPARRLPPPRAPPSVV